MNKDPQPVKKRRLRIAGRGWQSIVVVAVLFLGVASSAALFVVLSNRDQDQIRQDIAQRGQERVEAVKQMIELDAIEIRVTAAFFDSSNVVERHEFTSFLAPLLKDRPSVQSVQWAPRVPYADRSKLEEAAARDGYPGFRIHPDDGQSLATRASSSQHDPCYPIFYAVSTNNIAAVLGTDLATNPACLKAMNRACDTAQIAATPKIELSHKPGDQVGVRLFLPVYQKKGALGTVEERRKHLEGFVVWVLRLEEVLAESLDGLTPSGIDMGLFDSSDPRHPTLLAWHRSRSAITQDTSSQPSDVSFSGTFDVGGRRWTVVCVATPHFIASRTTWYPAAASLVVLLLTGLLTAYLVGIAVHTERMASLAAKLKQANQLLENDAANRKQSEATLRVSQTKYKTLFDSSSDAIVLMTPEGTCLAGNRASLAIYGCKSELELTSNTPPLLSPEYQPDGDLSATKAREMMAIAMEKDSHSFEWTHKRIDDGRAFLASVTLTRMDFEDSPLLLATVRDITEQRQAEEMLRISERRYRLFADNVSDVIWTMDLSGRFTYLSPSVESMLGFRWEEGMQFTVADMMTPSSIAITQEGMQRIAAAAQNGERLKLCLELELYRADGSTLWSEVTPSGFYDESGQLVGLLGVTRDITERRRLEEQQARSMKRLEGVNQLEEELLLRGPVEEKFKKITETAVDLLDLDFCRIWMIKPSDLCEEGCAHAAASEDLTPCRRQDECLHLMASAGRYTHINGPHGRVPIGAYKIGRIASGADNKFLTNSVTTDPRVHNHEWAKSLGLVSFAGYKLRDSDGNAIGVLAMFAKHPISEEDDAFIANLAETTSRVIMDKQAADAIEKENAKLSAMISGMEEGIVFADANNVVIEINDYLCRFVGRNRSDIVGKRIEDIHQGEILNRLLAKIEHFRQTPGAGPFVLQRAIGDSEVILRVQPIYRSGRYDGVLLNVIDVSELVKARRDAEIANQAKSRFLANMSHEIRTPMTAILGYADLLMDPRINASNRNNYSAIIHRSGEHLLTLINDILDLSKIESGKFLLEMQPCNIVSVLADVASLMRPRAESRGVSFSVEYPGELPETVLTDGARLRQAIINLVGNAIKFTERGSVRIVTTFMPTWRTDQPAVQIDVIDTGIGIRPEVLPDLFQPFNQGDSKVAQRFGGTGLGLAISRHITQMLGGDLNLTSVWGQGSTFVLTIPTGDLSGIRMLQRPTEGEQEAGGQLWRSTTKDLKGVRILLAEDGFDNRELIQTVLRTAGAEVEAAENGRIAMEKVENGVFDVILMDMNMPEMDGYEATRNLRDRGYTKPILALTANAMAGDSAQCLAAGCNEHLAKPINRTHLIRTIARYVGRDEATDRKTPGLAKDTSSRDEGIIISEFIDDPDMVEIIAGFVGRLGGQFVAMGQSFADGQYDELRRLAHMLKGAGGSYGYSALTDACKVLEDAAKAHDNTAIDAALDMVGAMIRAIENGFPLQAANKDAT